MSAKIEARPGNACASLSEEDFTELIRIAKYEVNSSTFLTTITGKVADVAAAAIPDWVTKAIESALAPALNATANFVSRTHSKENSDAWVDRATSYLKGEWFHKGAATVSGAVGGAFGLPTAVAEIAVSTGLIIRAIQDVARSHGADLTDPQTIAECMAVLAKGGPSTEDDTLDEAYWTIRTGLKKAVTPEMLMKGMNTEAIKKAAASKTIEQLLKSDAFQKLVVRFGITSQTVLAEKSVPVIGAALGALINYQFIGYYQNMAHVVYWIKAIEPRYETGQVASCYQRVLANVRAAKK